MTIASTVTNALKTARKSAFSASPASARFDIPEAIFRDTRIKQLVNMGRTGFALDVEQTVAPALQKALPLASGRVEQLRMARIAAMLEDFGVNHEALTMALKGTKNAAEALQVGRVAVQSGHVGLASEAFQTAIQRAGSFRHATRLVDATNALAGRTKDKGMREALIGHVREGLERAGVLAKTPAQLQDVAEIAVYKGHKDIARRMLTQAIERV